MKLAARFSTLRQRAFSVVEMMIAVSVLTIVMGAVYTGSSAMLASMATTENYSVGQLRVMDYLTLDLRRAVSYSFTQNGGQLTLPLDLSLPQYYAGDGRTPNVPQRSLVTTWNKKKKKKHKVFSARWYYHYGTLGDTVAVRYYLLDGTLYRKEGSLAARAIGTGIASVTFGPSAAEIEANPVVTTTVTFSPTKRAKQAPLPLTNSTFMRQYYYSGYDPTMPSS